MSRCFRCRRECDTWGIPIAFGPGDYEMVCSERCARYWKRRAGGDYQAGFTTSHPFVTEDWYSEPEVGV